jgi:1,5-anhydro-D-fructose reductase (1,5-anhydro-D-mannitol-forming)
MVATGSLRWGLIGASTMAQEFMGPAILRAGDSIVALATGTASRGAEVAERLGAPTVHGDYRRLVEDETVDAVYVSSSNELHAEHAIAAASAGRHVLCEKPLAISVMDGEHMLAEAGDAGVVLATNHHLRHAAGNRLVRRLVGDGEIGEVVGARLCHATLLPELWRGWRLHDPRRGGGVALDLTVHSIDLLRFVLRDDPVAVTGLGARQGMADEGLEDALMTVLRFRRGALAQIHDAFTVPHAETSLEILGTEGALVVTNAMLPSRGIGVSLRQDGDTRVLRAPEPENVYPRVVSAFRAAVGGSAGDGATGADGLLALRIALAARDSVASNGASVANEASVALDARA